MIVGRGATVIFSVAVTAEFACEFAVTVTVIELDPPDGALYVTPVLV